MSIMSKFCTGNEETLKIKICRALKLSEFTYTIDTKVKLLKLWD